MRLLLVIYVLILVVSVTQAKQKAEVQKSQVTKLDVVNLGEVEVESDFKQSDVQRKRESGYTYNRPNRISSNARFRIQTHPSRSQIAFKVPGQLSRPFTQYGPPIHSTSGSTTHGYHAQQQHRDKLQHDVSQQQSIGFGGTGLMEQEVPSPIRNVDFAEVNPIASQNDEPFGMNTANYLPPQNQKLPAYISTDNFDSQRIPGRGQIHDTNLQSQNFVQAQNQISDAALFLADNAQAIQQLYGAPASNQDFAPSNDQFQDVGNPIHNLNSQFESTSQNPEGFRGTLPSYASGTLDPRKTLEQIQSLEKDRLIVQLQQALVQAQTNPNVAGRYAQNQAGFIQNQELLASISQQVNSHIPTTPQSAAFGPGNTAFSQSTFLPETTVNPLRFPVNYGIPTTTQTPTTTTTAGILTTQSPLQPSKSDGIAQAVSSHPASNQPGSSTTGSPAGIPLYGGFVPSFITGTNFPSYGTSIFTSGSVRPVQSPETSPTHFGIPIPTEPPQKPVPGSAPSTPATTIPSLSPASSSNRPGFALTPVALPIQPIRPVAPFATPVRPIVAPLLPAYPAQVHPAQTAPTVSSSVQHSFSVQNALINPALYKPVKAVYPVYYYPVDIAYQLQKPTSPSYPWNYAPSYTTQTGPAKIWK
ncbi:uncharacterized protein [Temnothorax nylanderi]|uniref:uncharacterized protein n=1 Tax=Temnothorax nylanderi TaxID=102681 RepID=UPI003A85073E